MRRLFEDDEEMMQIDDEIQQAAENDYMKNVCKMFTLNIQSDYFANIQFPDLPECFNMCMKPFEMPEKAKININNSLPLEISTINNSETNDFAKRLFGQEFSSFSSITSKSEDKEPSYDSTETPKVMDLSAAPTDENPHSGENNTRTGVGSHEYTITSTDAYESKNIYKNDDTENYNFIMQYKDAAIRNLLLNELFNVGDEGVASLAAADIKVDNTKPTDRGNAKNGADVIQSITNYISKSLVSLSTLLNLVNGTKGNSSDDVKKVITDLESSSMKTIKEWVESEAPLLKKKAEKEENKLRKKNEVQVDGQKIIMVLTKLIMKDTSLQPKNADSFLKGVQKEIAGTNDEYELDEVVNKYFLNCSNLSEFRKMYNNSKTNFEINKNKISNENFEVNMNKYKKLNESDDDSEIRGLDYDEMYNNIYSLIHGAMVKQIPDAKEEWKCFKTMKENMEKMKKVVDEKMEEAINKVCKVDDKSEPKGPVAKALLSHPLRANGLKTMWSRYSDDLTRRLEMRIGVLTGIGANSNGSAEMLYEFLTVTYPRIISCMLVYKLIYEDIKRQAGIVIGKYTMTGEQMKEDIKEHTKQYADMFNETVSSRIEGIESLANEYDEEN